MHKQLLFFAFLLLSLNSNSQSKFESKSKVYSFSVPREYVNKPSNHPRNEFIFTDANDTTSMVVNVNDRPFDKNNLSAFKKATNAEVEKNYFSVLQNPEIVSRGDVETNKDRSIFFHVRHAVPSPVENDLMLTYIFYSKDKEINFIFRTKERRLATVLPGIQNIVNSVVLSE